jgi:hypothetical protein
METMREFFKVPTLGETIASWILKNYSSEEAKEIASRIAKAEWMLIENKES